MAPYTTPEQLDATHSILHKTFKSCKKKSIAWRKWQLKQLWWMIKDNESAIIKALHADLNRHEFESLATEIKEMEEAVLAHLHNLDEWAADEIQDAGYLFGTLAGARIRKEPLGVALIIAPWNFPLYLTVLPMIAAVSAGSCVMLKPAEVAVASQDLLVDIIPKYLDQDAIQVVTGADRETSIVLERRFDHIFNTGSPNVAKIVSAAAAKHLTPTVMELGGQNACFVTRSADVNLAAKRIVFSKYSNAGQICLDEILLKTSSGGVTINDVMLHAVVGNAPFGGVGGSGNGAYHGKNGFEAFTHKRAVVPVPGWFEYLLSFRYPPYDMKHLSKITVKNPNFKRGETMEEQSVGTTMATRVPRLPRTSAKWAAVAVIFALVDGRMGGKPRLLEMLGSMMGGLPSWLPS